MTRRGKKSGDRVRRGRRRSLFRGRLDGNEEERRNSFELTPLRFKGGDPLSLPDRPCARDMVVGRVSSALIVSWPP